VISSQIQSKRALCFPPFLSSVYLLAYIFLDHRSFSSCPSSSLPPLPFLSLRMSNLSSLGSFLSIEALVESAFALFVRADESGSSMERSKSVETLWAEKGGLTNDSTRRWIIFFLFILRSFLPSSLHLSSLFVRFFSPVVHHLLERTGGKRSPDQKLKTRRTNKVSCATTTRPVSLFSSF